MKPLARSCFLEFRRIEHRSALLENLSSSSGACFLPLHISVQQEEVTEELLKHFFFKLLGFMRSRHFSESDFDHMVIRFSATAEKSCPTVPGNDSGRTRNNRNQFPPVPDVIQNIQQFRTLHDRGKRTGGKTFAAEDTFFIVDFRNSLRIFADGIHRTGVFAGNRRFGDRMERTQRHALAAADALALINDGMLIFHFDRIHRTVVITGTRKTAAAVVGHKIFAVGTAGTAGAADRDRFLRPSFRFQRVPQIFLQRFAFICLVTGSAQQSIRRI